jgi:ribosome-associated protein
MTATTEAIQITNLAAQAAADKLGENLVAIDVTSVTPLNDIYLWVTGKNERQVSAIADEIEEKLQGVGVEARRREGKTTRRWILLDFGDLAVHVMHEEERMYYTHERLFGGCPTVQLAATK